MFYLVDFGPVLVMLRAKKDCKRYQHIPFLLRSQEDESRRSGEKSVRKVWSYSLAPLGTRPHGAKGIIFVE